MKVQIWKRMKTLARGGYKGSDQSPDAAWTLPGEIFFTRRGGEATGPNVPQGGSRREREGDRSGDNDPKTKELRGGWHFKREGKKGGGKGKGQEVWFYTQNPSHSEDTGSRSSKFPAQMGKKREELQRGGGKYKNQSQETLRVLRGGGGGDSRGKVVCELFTKKKPIHLPVTEEDWTSD